MSRVKDDQNKKNVTPPLGDALADQGSSSGSSVGTGVVRFATPPAEIQPKSDKKALVPTSSKQRDAFFDTLSVLESSLIWTKI